MLPFYSKAHIDTPPGPWSPSQFPIVQRASGVTYYLHLLPTVATPLISQARQYVVCRNNEAGCAKRINLGQCLSPQCPLLNLAHTSPPAAQQRVSGHRSTGAPGHKPPGTIGQRPPGTPGCIINGAVCTLALQVQHCQCIDDERTWTLMASQIEQTRYS